MNAGYYAQEYCKKQDEGPFGDDKVEENAVKFRGFHGHLHRIDSLNFYPVELPSGFVEFSHCCESWQ